MKEKTVGVYCPSYRRSDCIMTQNILNDVTYVVRASEEEAYRNAGVRKLISAPDEEMSEDVRLIPASQMMLQLR